VTIIYVKNGFNKEVIIYEIVRHFESSYLCNLVDATS